MSEAADMHPDDVNGRDGPEAPGEDRARELATLNTRLLDEIAKRKRAEEALRKSEERYREIFDEAPGALWVEDWSRVKRMIDRLAEEGVEDLRAYFAENRERIVEAYDRAEFIQASNANREFFGASSIDELEYASKGATVLPEELDVFLDVLFTFIDARWSGGVESVDDKMDGTPIIIHTEYVMPPSHRHDWSRVIYMLVDITERKRAEEALREAHAVLERRVEERTQELTAANARLREEIDERAQVAQSLRNSQDLLRESAQLARLGHMVWNFIEGRCVYCSDVYAEIHGVTADEFYAQASATSEGFCHADDRERIRAADSEALEGNTVEVKYRVVIPSGEIRHVHSIMRPHSSNDGKVFEVHEVLQDVTQITEAEARLQSAVTDAEQANRVKSELLAAMSHELRTPLNAIIGFSEMLIGEYFGSLGSPKYREYAGDIRSSSEHLLELVNDVLDLSAVEAGKYSLDKEPLVADDVIKDCSPIIKAAGGGKGITYSVECPDGTPPLYADRRALKQILLNILSNAVKFTPEGGRVTLKATASNGHHAFEVSDTGQGVPEDKLASLTDPFVRNETDPHKAQEGTGLGLAIVKSLVDLHHGELDIKSTLGKGTVVTVTLPSGET